MRSRMCCFPSAAASAPSGCCSAKARPMPHAAFGSSVSDAASTSSVQRSRGVSAPMPRAVKEKPCTSSSDEGPSTNERVGSPATGPPVADHALSSCGVKPNWMLIVAPGCHLRKATAALNPPSHVCTMLYVGPSMAHVSSTCGPFSAAEAACVSGPPSLHQTRGSSWISAPCPIIAKPCCASGVGPSLKRSAPGQGDPSAAALETVVMCRLLNGAPPPWPAPKSKVTCAPGRHTAMIACARKLLPPAHF
eukprot:5962937-Pleurochrysis_carterae.AAC.3